jgi:trans-aconitate 2-methyltransferase
MSSYPGIRVEMYWDERYRNEGRIWGSIPSATAVYAETVFRSHEVKSILVPGAGYGRHSEFFSQKGYAVTGIEISGEALRLAPPVTRVKYLLGSVLEMPLGSSRYDAVYCFNVLHLLIADERRTFLQRCFEALREGGVAFFVVFSEQEAQYGKGNRIEENTFESKPGRPVHFFTGPDLLESFRDFGILETGFMDDPEDHGAEGPHVHRLRYITAVKKSAFEFDGDRYKAASRHQKEWGRQLIGELDLEGNECVLDLGSGDGTLTKELALRVHRGNVLGIDASEGMIAAAKKLEGGNLRFERRNIDEMDFNDEFDVIFSNAALHWVKDHRNLLERCGQALRKDGYLRFNFAGDGNCATLNSVIRRIMLEEQFRSHFTFFEWPWYMPSLVEYERMIKERAEFDEIRVWEENADRLFSQDELVRWIDQPSLVPFLKHIKDAAQSAAFRNAVVQAMLHATKHREGEYFETFRRLDVFARKR